MAHCLQSTVEEPSILCATTSPKAASPAPWSVFMAIGRSRRSCSQVFRMEGRSITVGHCRCSTDGSGGGVDGERGPAGRYSTSLSSDGRAGGSGHAYQNPSSKAGREHIPGSTRASRASAAWAPWSNALRARLCRRLGRRDRSRLLRVGRHRNHGLRGRAPGPTVAQGTVQWRGSHTQAACQQSARRRAERRHRQHGAVRCGR